MGFRGSRVQIPPSRLAQRETWQVSFAKTPSGQASSSVRVERTLGAVLHGYLQAEYAVSELDDRVGALQLPVGDRLLARRGLRRNVSGDLHSAERSKSGSFSPLVAMVQPANAP